MTGNSPHFARKSSREKSYIIEIDNVSKRHLRFFMSNELLYYNELINNVTMKLRAFPEEVTKLRDGYGKLWSTLAFTGLDLRNYLGKGVKSWPKILLSALPSSAIQNDAVVIDHKKALLFDALAVTGNIHPKMRKNLASEVLSTILPQADQLVMSQKNGTGQMRDPVYMLMPKMYPERRHIQLTSDLIKIKWNKEKGWSEITVPYTDKPLIVKDHNLSEEKFNIVLIRQQPGIPVADDTPWQIDLMITSHNYLLDLTDQSLHTKKRKAA